MNKDSSIVNVEAGKILDDAITKHPKTQIEIAKDLGMSTKQLRNYAGGVFPKYKRNTVRAIDNYFKTNLEVEVYGSEPKQEQNVPRETGNTQTSAKSSLERSIENLTQNELRTTAVIERLVALLERQYDTGPQLVPPGTPGTIPITKGEKQKTSR